MSDDSMPSDPELEQQIERAREITNKILDGVGRQVVGQNELRKRLLTALITDGHILLEGVPGLAKTRSIKALADSVDASFKRIQFTPDLLPADLVGTEIFKPEDSSFQVRKGPVFANFVLADEINRAPAKVQSALLETMQERQVTIGNETFSVPDPFLVLATQNPVEQEGTYPLPEAQIDRFLMKVYVDYPSSSEEAEILDMVVREGSKSPQISPVASLEEVAFLKETVAKIYVDDRVKKYIVNLVHATRDPKAFNIDAAQFIELGASPRATISLYLSARVEALLSGSRYVVPQNVKDIAHDVLRHRIMPTYEAEAQNLTSDTIVQQLLDGVQVP